MDDQIMNFKEAMAFLKIPRSTLYKLVQEKKVPAMKVGRHWRFSRLSLERWISGDENEATQRMSSNGNDSRLYCWQSDRRIDKNHDCTRCLTYKVRALNCFILRNEVSDELVRCDKACKECDYFQKNFD